MRNMYLISVVVAMLTAVSPLGWGDDLKSVRATQGFARRTWLDLRNASDRSAISNKRQKDYQANSISVNNSSREETEQSRIERAIHRSSGIYGINSNFIRAVIRVESDFRPTARSSKGAIGLMQLMPATARDLGVLDPISIDQNVDGGSRYLYHLLWEFKDPRCALVGYNAGPEVVRKRKRIPRETKIYIERVFKEFHRLENSRKNGR